MTVAIVSALPKALPAADAEGTAPVGSGTESNAGLDFSSLLQGQLAAPLTPQTTEILPDSPALATTDSQPGADNAVQSDAAALLAALGMATDIARQTIDKTQPGKDGASLQISTSGKAPVAGEALLAGLAATGSGTTPESLAGAGKPQSSDETAAFTSASENPTAKFAVSAATRDAAASLSSLQAAPGEASSNQAASLVNSLQQPAMTTAQHRDSNLSIQTPVRDAAWSSDFSQKIVWLATNERQSAQMTLNPPQMGPIEITLNINKDNNATAVFVSANAEVREAIETAMPRLREMLATAGIELGQANVSAESFQQSANSRDAASQTGRPHADTTILDGSPVNVLSTGTDALRSGLGLVDTFA